MTTLMSRNSRRIPHFRTLAIRAGLSLSLLLLTITCSAQSAPPKEAPPLTEREQEMMNLIKSLQERVAKLEAEAHANSKGTGTDGLAGGALNSTPAAEDPQKASSKGIESTTAAAAAANEARLPGDMAGDPSLAAAQESTAQNSSQAQPVTGSAQAMAEPEPEDRKPTKTNVETWGDFDPGEGFLLGRSKIGELSLSAYGLLRYINQLPASQSFTDHLGNEHNVDTRNDLFAHRFMVFFKGWLGTRKLIYNITLWTVNTTDQKAIFGMLGYQFSRKFSLYGGLNGLPGTRSIQGSHPYWLAPDRVMADEFFRPYFTNSVWAQGEILPGLWYNAVLGNNNSSLGVKATDLDRKLTYGTSAWWMPTTREFGPRGAYGDWEYHDKVATRFGFGYVKSPENRQISDSTGPSNNTTLRLADSLNVFDTGSLAPDVTVQTVDYRVFSTDAAVKYKGFFLQFEYYNRWLDKFVANGPLPVKSIHDHGFYIQGAFYPIKHRLELYGVTSQIFGDKDAGFDNSSEYIGGANYYITRSRNYRINAQVMNVNRSPVSSTFGYYVGGQNGTTVSTAASFFF
jgi:hypothetical protein